ncbi:hypothetical protein AVEN_272316-1 [Araneus ventricosus]|uniref:Uncharacterized protein n=1 Tax=Araneus ventricosus TaxID=182803 RepID=A0A4Y2IZP3_ARAVE|nr:hypothetical protein AVEN_272316-1 [Araneus ventricosus]
MESSSSKAETLQQGHRARESCKPSGLAFITIIQNFYDLSPPDSNPRYAIDFSSFISTFLHRSTCLQMSNLTSVIRCQLSVQHPFGTTNRAFFIIMFSHLSVFNNRLFNTKMDIITCLACEHADSALAEDMRMHQEGRVLARKTRHSPLFNSAIFGTLEGRTFRQCEKPMKIDANGLHVWSSE